jgi:hypothetical protein
MHMNTVERFHVYNTDKKGLHMNEIYANSNPTYNNHMQISNLYPPCAPVVQTSTLHLGQADIK